MEGRRPSELNCLSIRHWVSALPTHCLTTHCNLSSSYFKLLYAVTALSGNGQPKKRLTDFTQLRKGAEGRPQGNDKKGNSAECSADSPGQHTNTPCDHGEADAAVSRCDCTPGERGDLAITATAEQRGAGLWGKLPCKSVSMILFCQLQQEFIPEKMSHTHLSQTAKLPATD